MNSCCWKKLIYYCGVYIDSCQQATDTSINETKQREKWNETWVKGNLHLE